MKKHVLFVLLALLFVPVSSRAQGLGSLDGRVSDPSGAAVASAKVIATQQGTTYSRTAVTDAEGLYVIPSLEPSTYNLTVEAAGFSTSKENGINLLADQTLTVNFGLKLGMTTEVVMVSGNALQVDTSTSTLKQVIEQQRLVELPLNGRNAAQLTLLVPGTVNSPGGGADQVSTKTFPFPDALQEFSVQTSNYSSEYGQNAGAVVNVITKSGTNNFHGDVFEFLRNSVFNARGFFAPFTLPNGQPTKDKGRDQIKRNQFGGTVGGPIIHDKTFFFAGYQGTRFRNIGNASRSTLPSTNFAPNAIPASGPVTSSAICNPGPNQAACDIETYLNTGGPGGGPGTIDPVSLNILKGLPLTASRTVIFLRPQDDNYDEVSGKADHSFSRR